MFRLRDSFDHKKTDLPISTSRLKPRKSNGILGKLQEYKNAVIGVVCLLVLIIYLISGSKEDQRSDSLGHYEDEYPHEAYEVTADGVNKLSGTEDDSEVDDEIKVDENDERIEYYDLNMYQGNANSDSVPDDEKDIVLLCIPLRNAEKVLPLMFRNMMNMTYPHSQIDISFLVSDCTDDGGTIDTLFEYSQALQRGRLLELLEERDKELESKGVKGSSDLYLQYMPGDYADNVKKAYSPPYHDEYTKPFRSIQIYRKDFGQIIGQGFSDRHDLKVQGIRRKLMGRARNWLLSMSLKPYHSWVYWRDADIETSPGDILQNLMKFGTEFDVIVPNVWRPLPTFLGSEQPYDLNSWMESEAALELAKTLDEEDVIVEGYVEYPTWRVHLAYIRDINGDKDEIVDLDGVGGVSILSKAKVFRQGSNFPAFTFENHAETEAFGKLTRKMGFRVGGLPHYTIWHIYEPSEDDLLEISRLERKKRRMSKRRKDSQNKEILEKEGEK